MTIYGLEEMAEERKLFIACKVKKEVENHDRLLHEMKWYIKRKKK